MGGGGEEVFCSRSMRKAASSANMRLHTSTYARCPIVELGLCRQRLTSQRLNYPSLFDAAGDFRRVASAEVEAKAAQVAEGQVLEHLLRCVCVCVLGSIAMGA